MREEDASVDRHMNRGYVSSKKVSLSFRLQNYTLQIDLIQCELRWRDSIHGGWIKDGGGLEK